MSNRIILALCMCCGARFKGLEHERYCSACAGGNPKCRVCDGLALDRYLAATNEKQKDLFRV